MAQDGRALLEFLKFELKFLEDGGYGRSPHAPRREPQIFEDSPSCLNFDDPDKPHPCSGIRYYRDRFGGAPCCHGAGRHRGDTVRIPKWQVTARLEGE